MISVLDSNHAMNLIHSPLSRLLRFASLASILGFSAVLLTIMVITTPGVAQTPGPNDGIALLSTRDWGVDLASSAVHLSFPLRSKAGKIPYSSSLESTNYYAITFPKTGGAYWTLYQDPFYGPSFRDTVSQISLTGTAVSARCTNTLYSYATYTVTSITDGFGTQHRLPNQFQWIRVTNAQGCINQSQKNAASIGVTDNTGYTLYANTTGFPVVYDKAGDAFTVPVPSFPCCTSNGKFTTLASTVTNPDSLSVSGDENNGGAITDTLNTVVANVTGLYHIPATSESYNDASDNPQQYTMVYTALPLKTNFHCASATIVEMSGTYNLLTSIQGPAGHTSTISYEPTPGFSGYYTGRVAQITFPTGGSISYAYSDSNGNNGIDCSGWSSPTAPSVPTITVTVNDNNGNSSIYTYVHSTFSANPQTVTKTDPAGNQTAYTFYGEFQTQVQYFQGTATGTPLKTVVTCYNGNFVNCANPSSVALPITRMDVYTSLNGSSYSVTETKYDSYSNHIYQATYDYNQALGAAPSGTPLQATITSYASIGTYIRDKPSCTQVTSGSAPSSCGTVTSNTTSLTNYTNYTSTGHARTVSRWVSGTSFLTTNYTYNANGTVATMTDVNAALDTYAYNGTNGCNGLLPTSVTVTGVGLPSAGLKTSAQWDCNGGVVTQTIDVNSQSTINTYNDPLWRLTSVQDPAGTTSTCYGIISGQTCTANTTQRETVLPVSGTTSAVDSLTTIDGLDRTIFVQTRKTPTSSTFDSVQYTYAWNTTGAVTTVSAPYSGTQGQAAPAGTSATTQYDALGRTQSVTDPGTGAGAVTSVFNQNDVLQALSPAPSGENTKQKQLQYDGMGRLTSVCEITAGNSTWPGGNCAQTSAQTGYWTKYAYDNPANSLTVTQNAQGSTTQTRSYTYDGLGRLTSEANPESGVKSYVWDTTPASSCGATQTFNGDLVRTVDGNGTNTCSYYDALHRLTDVGTNRPSIDGCKRFRYDNTQGVTGTMPTGVSVGNTMDRLAEAETDGCSPFPPTSASIITDEWFSYDNDGRNTDAYESTPNSGGYYHPTAAYWPNGALETLWISTLPVISYVPDGEGRLSTVSANSGQNPVTATSYNAASQVTGVTFGSGDADAFTYDSKTGRMTQYEYTINGSSEIGVPTWNPNGSVKSLAITDPFNPGDAQTCNYAHDDLSRIASVGCGSVWSQTFTYDPFGNVTKSGSISWQPGYNGSNNQYTLAGTSYDSDGNLLNDTFHAYTWNAYGRPTTIDSITRTYDAFDRIVEQNLSGTFYQTVYDPTGGKLGVFNGSTIQQLYVPLPGGAAAEYYSWGLSNYRHSDWVGSDRLESSASNHSILGDNAYAPFGEPYAQTGNGEISFTGQNKDTVWLQYDFLFRQYDPKQGRWISPDPAGLSAADPGNPQSWNRYSYVEDSPLSAVDPTGLQSPSQQTQNNIRQFNHCLSIYPPQGSTSLEFSPCMYDSPTFPTHCLLDGLEVNCSLALTPVYSGAAVICPECRPGTMVGPDDTIYKLVPIGTLPNCEPTRGGGCNFPAIWDLRAAGAVSPNEIPIIDEPGNPGPNIDEQVLNQRVNALSQAVNKTGVQSLGNPCTTAAWLTASALAGAVGAPAAGAAAKGAYDAALVRWWTMPGWTRQLAQRYMGTILTGAGQLASDALSAAKSACDSMQNR